MKTDKHKDMESYHEQQASLDGGASVVVVEEVVSGVLVDVVITVEVVVVASVVVVSAVHSIVSVS